MSLLDPGSTEGQVPATSVSPAPALGGASSAPALEIRSLSKTFVGGRALDEVDLTIPAGEVHALLGENGSGKSTLIKVLSGYHKPDAGAHLMIAGVELTTGAALASYQAGARFVHQDLGLIEDCSITDNLAFGPGFPTRFGTIRHRMAHRRTTEALHAVGLDVDPKLLVSRLSPAQKTGVAVARALLVDPAAPAHLLVLDEPTARLPEHEVLALLDMVRRVASSGIGVLYVTHRLDEVFELADRASVLRDGHLVACEQVADLTRESLLHHLLGAALEKVHREHQDVQASVAPVLQVLGLSSDALDNVSLEVRPGEIVGVAGITGSGREALVASIFGARLRDLGSVVVRGTTLPGQRPDLAMAAGVAYVPAERKLEGCFVDLTARENIGFASLNAFWRRPALRQAQERAMAERWFEDLDIRPRTGAEQKMSTFSGGNQQKVIYGKWFQRKPVLYLLDEPTQGVDVGAKAELHKALFRAAEQGAGVLVSSTDIDELITICDRVIVLRGRQVVAHLHGSQITPHALTRASLGIDDGDTASAGTLEAGAPR